MEEFGKIQPERKHQRDKRGICWCGDPACGGGLVGGAGSFRIEEISISPFSRASRDAERYLTSGMERLIYGSIFQTAEAPGQSGPPKGYTEAREAVKDYLLEVNHATAWDDIVGNDAARTALMEAIEEPKLNPDLYDYYGMSTPKGVLLYGPPGCGKTMFAKAAAAAVGRIYGAKAEVLVINGPQIQSPYVGRTEEKIRAIFKFAREYAAYHKHPLTVFFDEAEVLFPDRTGRARRVMPWEESQVAQFLAEMDGLNTMGAFVILATNRPEAIDEALLRDGRCDRKIKVERPNRAAVEHILQKTLASAPCGDDVADLVMAGVESFFNPHYVIRDAHIIAGQMTADGPQLQRDIAVNFCLEHIVSGAMVVGLVQRAKSIAFARDRQTGERSGLKTADMMSAVRQVFDENKTLDHAFAMREWVESLQLKEMVRHGGVWCNELR